MDAESHREVFLPLRITLRHVQVELPGHAMQPRCPITPAFWRKCPQLRSAEIGRWMEKRGDMPWPHRMPPHYEAELTVLSADTATLRVRSS